MSPLSDTLARRAVERSVADREAEYGREVRRIVDATYELIERTGTLDPSLRDILAHTGLSTQAFYRLFRSKDELFLVLLDDGRRQLVEYLSARMAAEPSPSGQVRAWIVGVLAQATTRRSADRTRPFLANESRLSDLFPEEQRESVDLLIGLLSGPLAALTGEPESSESVHRDAEAIYRLVFGLLHAHLLQRIRPAAPTVDHTVRFCLRGVGVEDGAT